MNIYRVRRLECRPVDRLLLRQEEIMQALRRVEDLPDLGRPCVSDQDLSNFIHDDEIVFAGSVHGLQYCLQVATPSDASSSAHITLPLIVVFVWVMVHESSLGVSKG